MNKEQEILADEKIAKFLATHQGAADEINRAARQLANERDAIPAVRKLLDPLVRKVVRVFFSFKAKDILAAKAIVELLRTTSAGKLEIRYQGDFNKEITGKKWRDAIHGFIAESDWFLLLLPDPNDDWDWCLFETGLFEAQRTSADRLICLYHPDTRVPNQIEDYHAVRAAIPDVEEFLQMVYLRDNPIPGMPAINPHRKDIPDLARKIVEAIRPPRRSLCRRVFEPWLELRIENAANLENRDDLDAAAIENANKEVLDLFNYDVIPQTWGELRSTLPEGSQDSRWREELFHVVRKIANGRKFDPIQAVFQTKEGKMYRPVACAIDRLGDDRGPIEKFHITFTEDIAAVDHSEMPRRLSSLATVLRFVFRFRWEVLEKFGRSLLQESDVQRVESAFKRLQTEWESRGVGDQAAIESLFSEKQAKDRVSRMFQEWATIRNREGTGELDVAIEKRDTKAIQEILKRLIPMNQEFLEISTEIFSKLIHDKA